MFKQGDAMNYKVESVDGCTRKISFNFETIDLSSEIKTALVRKQKTVSLKGFRKGKAPLSVVEKMYRPQVEGEALNQFVQGKFFEAVNEEKLNLIGTPSFENVDYKPGESVSFDAVIEIFPEVKVKDMSGYSFDFEKPEVTDEDVDNIKNSYLNSKAEIKEVEDENATLDKGLYAVLNFQGTKEDGSQPENMASKEYLLEIGSNQFIPGFEEGLVGMKAGEKKDLDLSFPEDYHFDELKGQKVTFHVEILEIKSKELPELTDDLAKEFGYESVADFTEKTKTNLFNQKNKQSVEKLNNEILEKLVAENPFDVPKALVAQQEKMLAQDLEKSLEQQGFNDELKKEYFEKWGGDLKEKALFRVRSGVILDNLARDFEIETNDSDFEAKIEESAGVSGVDPAQIKQYYESNPQLKSNVMYAIREEKTFDKIKETVKLNEK
jgi:trigger factor